MSVSSNEQSSGEAYYTEIRTLDTMFLMTAVPGGAGALDLGINVVLEQMFAGYEVTKATSLQDARYYIQRLIETERALIVRELHDAGIAPYIRFADPQEVSGEFLRRAKIATEQSPLGLYNVAVLLESGVQHGFVYFVHHGLDAFLIVKAAGSWLLIECARRFGHGLRNKTRELVETLLSIPLDELKKRFKVPGAEHVKELEPWTEVDLDEPNLNKPRDDYEGPRL